MEVAFFEPWYGGSHRAFLDAWSRRSSHTITVHGLAARNWKWRQEASAWELARSVTGAPPPDVIACSDFVDLPRLMGCLPPTWADTPTLVYFHENQLTYTGDGAEADFTHGFSNILSAARADALVFNSEFHRAGFEQAALELLRRLPRPNPRADFAERMGRALVVAPLPELADVPPGPGPPNGAPLRIAFPHRLEPDKDPCAFFAAVLEASSQTKLEVVLLGGDLKRASAPIRAAAESIAPLIVHEGHCHERDDYLRHLGASDVVVSTARHEFFGVAFTEAMAAGCTPLAPDRLNYPALVAQVPEPSSALFGSQEALVERLVDLGKPAALAELRSREQRQAMGQSVQGFGAQQGATALDAVISTM